MSRYQRWYDQIIDRAKGRAIPTCYTELHHIVPRSLGGCDAPSNLARLTYREHFIVHWLLTKFKTGGELRKMQRALFAMTLSASGRPVATGWQFEAAKRAIRDLEIDPEAERQFYERWRRMREQRAVLTVRRRQERKALAQADVGLLLSAGRLDRGGIRDLSTSFFRANKPAPRVRSLMKRARWRNAKKRASQS